MGSKSAPMILSPNMQVSIQKNHGTSLMPNVRKCVTAAYPIPTMPRRYEDTKPIIVQEFGHKRILSLGSDIHHRLQSRFDDEKENAVKEAESKVWAKAEKIKQKALDEQMEIIQSEHKDEIKKLIKEHKKTIQERILETETLMARETLEAIENERALAEERLEAAIEDLETSMKKEMNDIEDKVTKREREKAAVDIKHLIKRHQQEIKELKQKLLNEKIAEITNLIQKHAEELKLSIRKAKEHEIRIKIDALQEQKQSYDEQITELNFEIKSLYENIQEGKNNLKMEETSRIRIEDELLQVGHEFSEFVHRVLGIQDGEGDYLLPSKPIVQEILAKRGLLSKETHITKEKHRSPSVASVSFSDPKVKSLLPKINRITEDFA